MSCIVYKISSESLNKNYYGSTSLTIEERKWQHISDFNRFSKGDKSKTYCSAIEILQQSDWKIQVIEENIDRDILLERERYYIENFDCINVNIPFRTVEERKEQQRLISKKWSEENKEKEKIRLHESYQRRKEEIAKRYIERKEEIDKRKREPYKCDCGSIVSTGHKSSHFNTKKHLLFLETKH
jgi:hypothetical protein